MPHLFDFTMESEQSGTSKTRVWTLFVDLLQSVIPQSGMTDNKNLVSWIPRHLLTPKNEGRFLKVCLYLIINKDINTEM